MDKVPLCIPQADGVIRNPEQGEVVMHMSASALFFIVGHSIDKDTDLSDLCLCL